MQLCIFGPSASIQQCTKLDVGLGIMRIDAQGIVECADSLVPLVLPYLNQAPVVVCFTPTRIERHRAAVMLRGLLNLSPFSIESDQIYMRHYHSRIHSQR